MSKLFQNVLVPVDLSPCSRAALRMAARIAELSGGELAVLHATDPAPGGAGATSAELASFVRAVLELDSAPPIHVVAGLPRDVILATAEKLGSDAIVLGTHGRTGRARMLIGSVAESVVRAAQCPVVTVREPE